jgi:LmbE family N-acetylglucosaminyl deacetylase
MALKTAAKAKPTARKKAPPIEETWAGYERALVITAHPDDAEFMAGGTIAKLVDLGLEVTLAVATSGDKGTRDINLRPQELAAIREAEQRAAAKVLGLHRVIFMGYPDLHRPSCAGTLSADPAAAARHHRHVGRLPASFNHGLAVGRVVRDALPAARYYSQFNGRRRTVARRGAACRDRGREPPRRRRPYLEKKVDAILCPEPDRPDRPRRC